MSTAEEYLHFVEKAKEKAGAESLALWELKLFNEKRG